MKLLIKGGSLDVEFEKGSLVNEAKKQLDAAAREDEDKIKSDMDKAGFVSDPTKDGLGALDRKRRTKI